MYTKDDLLNDLKKLDIKSDDTLLIHSSYSKIKNIEGGSKTILSCLKDLVKDGLLIFPTHTWDSIKNDGDIFDVTKANSCVGYLTNQAIKDKDFIRSNHPTHSVCVYGAYAKEYIKDDDYAKTPVSPNGSFGKLKHKGKILFLGAPLSKNTFIHSIEEEFNVEDRFTSHIYTFYTKTLEGKMLEFHMPRHYSSLNPHISDNYEKLLPILLEKSIAKKITILGCTSYLIDSKKLYDLVSNILKKDIHAFDDLRRVDYE